MATQRSNASKNAKKGGSNEYVFDPKAIQGFDAYVPTDADKHKPESFYLKVQSFEQREVNGKLTTYAIGSRLEDDSARLAIRLNSVNERVGDLLHGKSIEEDEGEVRQRVQQVYVNSEHARPTIKKLQGKEPTVIKFDAVLPINAENNEYRAHWAKPVCTKAFDHQMALATVVVTPERENMKALAYVETMDNQVVIRPENIKNALEEALRPQHDNGMNRKPTAHLRIFQEGKMLGAVRVYNAWDSREVYSEEKDDTSTVYFPASGRDSVDRLLAGEEAGIPVVDRNHDVARAVFFGMMNRGADEKNVSHPVMVSKDPVVQKNAKAIYNAVLNGAVDVDLISGERLEFGMKSRSNALADMESYENRQAEGKKSIYNAHAAYKTVSKKKVPGVVYVGIDKDGVATKTEDKRELLKSGFSENDIREEQGERTQRKIQHTYTPTVISVGTRENNSRFVTFAEPLSSYRKMTAVADIEFGNGLEKLMPNEKTADAAHDHSHDQLNLQHYSDDDDLALA